MAHVTLKQSYKSLSDRLNLFLQGAPPTELLFRILQVLFTEEEAAPMALLSRLLMAVEQPTTLAGPK